MKRLMVIGGGEWQVPIVQTAKEMGIFVVNTNLYPDSPAFHVADAGVVIDVLDKEKNLDCAREYGIDAVITDQSDIAVSTVAYVSEQLGLPGIGTNTSSLFTNKFKMRELCSKQGFPTPQYKLCQELSDAYSFIDECGLPIVVKPPANQSSRGVAKVSSIDQVSDAYKNALQYSHDGKVLLEEFLGGVELTVDGVQLNAGGHYCLATSFKTHYKHNEMVASQLWFSQDHCDINYDELHRQHNRLIKEMLLPFGLTHAEYKYYQGKFYLIEVAARGGGTRLSSDIVPLMGGIDSNQLLIRMALGEKITSICPVYKDRVAALDFFEFKPGHVKAITGAEKLMAIRKVVSMGLNVEVGDVITPARDDRARHGYVIAYDANADALRNLLAEIHQTIQVHYD